VSLFLTILEGEDPTDAVPVIASEDPDLIRLVGCELARRLGARPEAERVLRLVREKGNGRLGREVADDGDAAG
jgi:hypothetical protein